MKLLILGGTKFVGRHLVEAAQARGHEITLFNRGQANPDLFSELEQLRGDRDGDLGALEGRSWDAVIDTSGYVPRVVRDSATLLADAVGHYTFISSLSVYADPTQGGIDEQGAVATLEEETEEITHESYGALKALCEQAVEEAMPGRALQIRPGLIVGPFDPTDRFTYWPYRIAQGEEVLAPGDPAQPVQFIDARDLAEWVIRLVEQGAVGTYNATGPAEPLSIEGFLAACEAVAQGGAALTWVSEAFLLEEEVEPFRELPLWLPAHYELFGRTDCRKAQAAGLRHRPLPETIQDTLAWANTRPAGHEWRAGLSPAREAALLARWHERG